MFTALQHIWYGAVAVYNVSNKIMVTYWKVYITLSQKFSMQLKENIINDEPIEFLCTEIKKIVSSLNHNDEASLKLITYMMSVLVKLCSYGCVLKSHTLLVEFILFLNRYKYIFYSHSSYNYLKILKIYINLNLFFFWCVVSYWLSDTQNAVAVKDRLLQFVDQLVLISDEKFVKVIYN